MVGTGRRAEALPLVEIDLIDAMIYDREVERRDLMRMHTPARLSPDVAEKVARWAVVAHNSVGASGVSRVDFRVNGKSIICLEVNGSPALGVDEHLPLAAQAAGWSYDRLINYILEDALERWHEGH